MQDHGLQAIPLHLCWKNFGKPVGCTVLLELCLKFSACGFHGLEHVSQVEQQAHLSVWRYT